MWGCFAKSDGPSDWTCMQPHAGKKHGIYFMRNVLTLNFPVFLDSFFLFRNVALRIYSFDMMIIHIICKNIMKKYIIYIYM